MQNIKNVVEAIGTDIGNINRNYQSLTARLQRVENGTAPAAPSDDVPAGESRIIELRFTHNLPDPSEFGTASEFNGGINLPIPPEYVGKYSLRDSTHLTESYYWGDTLRYGEPIILHIIDTAPVVQLAATADLSSHWAERMNAFALRNYTDYEPLGSVPALAYGWAVWVLGNELANGLAMPEGANATLSSSYLDFIRNLIEQLESNDASLKTAIEEGSSVRDALNNLGINDLYYLFGYVGAYEELYLPNITDYAGYKAHFEKLKNGIGKLEQWLNEPDTETGYNSTRAKYLEALKAKREAQHGEEIRKLVAAGAVLVD